MLYLIPLRLQRGCLPSRILLDYIPPLKRLYEPFIEAFRSSDLAKFDRALDKHAGIATTTSQQEEKEEPKEEKDEKGEKEGKEDKESNEKQNGVTLNKDQHEPGLLEKGTYLIMLRAREGCVRGLCKQV